MVNPTVKHIRLAYKKLVVRVNNIPSFNPRNYIPLNYIDILLYSSIDLTKLLNNNFYDICSNFKVGEDILNII